MNTSAPVVGIVLKVDGDRAVKAGLDGVSQAFAVSADEALRFEKATAAVAVAQARADAAITKATAAQRAYAEAVRIGIVPQERVKDLQQQATQAAAAQATALVALKEKASGLKVLQDAHTGVANSTKMSAYQTSQLGAQLQDLFIQIQGGQSVMTAFSQQGSQLSAVFGGVRPALAALGSLVTVSTLAIGGMGAALAAVGAAWYSGNRESAAFRQSLALTSNAAGVTADSLQAMAQTIGEKTKAGIGDAKDALYELVASGRVSVVALESTAMAATALARATGESSADVAKRFSAMAGDVAGGAAKLNQQYHFLTAAQLANIKTMEEHGNAMGALAVVMDAFGGHVSKTVGEIGLIERAWVDAKKEMSAFKDMLLGIGRDDTPGGQLAKLKAQIAELDRAGQKSYVFGPSRAELAAQAEGLQVLVDGEKTLARMAGDAVQRQKDETKSIQDRQAAAKKATEAHKKLIEEGKTLAADMLDQLGGLNGDFTEKWDSLGIAYKAGAISLEKLTKAQAVLLTQQPAMKKAAESAEKAAEAATKAYLEEGAAILDAAKKIGDAAQQSLAAAIGRTRSLEDEATALALSKTANISLAEAVERVGLARLREQLDAANASGNTTQINAIKAEIAVREQLIKMVGSKVAREANDAAAKEAQAVWERTFDQVGDALYDALTGNWASAKRLIESQIIRPVVQAVTGPVTSAVTNAITGTSNASTGASALSAASNASSLYGQAASAANYGAVYSGQAYGTGFATQQSSMLAAQEAGMTSQAGSSAMGTWGAYAGYAAMIYAAAQYASSLYNKGFTGSDQIEGKGWYEMTPEAMKTTVLEKLGLSDKWSEILGGSVRLNHMFGHAAPRVDQSGVSGSFSGGQFTGQNYADITEKGGLFRSDKHYTQTAAMDDAIGRFFDDAAQSVYSQAANYGKALGLPAEQLAGVSTDIKLALTDDKDANMKAITDALSGYGDALVSGYAAAVAPLAKYGETTAQTIERVGAALGGVNDVLGMLGKAALAASIDGGKAAIELQGMFGSMDTLQQAASSYMQDFYTTAERAALTTKAVTGALAEVGLSMPATRAAFRSLVDAQDLTTDAGRRAFTALMGVESAFASVVPAAEAAASSVASLAEVLSGLMGGIQEEAKGRLDALSSAITDQKNALTAQYNARVSALDAQAQAAQDIYQAVADQVGKDRDAARLAYDALDKTLSSAVKAFGDSVNALKDLNSSLSNTLRQMRPIGSEATDRASAQAQIAQALAVAKATGVLPTAADLQDALSVIAKPSEALFTNANDYLRDFYRTQIALTDLQGITVAQQTTAQAQLDAATTKLTGAKTAYDNTVATGDVKLSVAGATRDATLATVGANKEAAKGAYDSAAGALDSQLALATAQYNQLAGINTGVQDLGSLFKSLGEALASWAAASGKATPDGVAGIKTGEWVTTGKVQTWADAAGAVAVQATGNNSASGAIVTAKDKKTSFSVAEMVAFIQDQLAQNNPMAIYEAAMKYGIGSSSIDAAMGWAKGTSLKWATDNGLPAFAAGGMHAGGIRLVGETGPELEVTGPSRIWSASQTRAMLQPQQQQNLQPLIEEVKALREEVKRQREENLNGQLAIASNTSQTSRILKRWEGGGMPTVRDETP